MRSPSAVRLGDNGFAYVAGGGGRLRGGVSLRDDQDGQRRLRPRRAGDDHGIGLAAWRDRDADLPGGPGRSRGLRSRWSRTRIGNIYWDQWAPEEHDFGCAVLPDRAGSGVACADDVHGRRLRPARRHGAQRSQPRTSGYPRTVNRAPRFNATQTGATSTWRCPSSRWARRAFFRTTSTGSSGVPSLTRIRIGHHQCGRRLYRSTGPPLQQHSNGPERYREICFQSTLTVPTNLATLMVATTAAATYDRRPCLRRRATYGDSLVASPQRVTSASAVNVGHGHLHGEAGGAVTLARRRHLGP